MVIFTQPGKVQRKREEWSRVDRKTLTDYVWRSKDCQEIKRSQELEEGYYE